MTEDRKPFKIAIPLEMKRWLAIQSAKNMRSQSSEILLAVRERMERENKKAGEPLNSTPAFQKLTIGDYQNAD